MISSGKSTLVSLLVEHYKNNLQKPAYFLNEFKENDVVFNNLLKWHLEKKPNITLSFELYVLDSHISELYKIENELKKQFVDYFLFLDRFSVEHIIFSQIAFENDPKRWRSYKTMANKMIDSFNIPDFVIYLDVNFETFKNRIFQRNRKAEIDNWNINEVYYKKLHNDYKSNFIKLCQEYGVNYCILDTNNKNQEEVLNEALLQIENFRLNSKFN